MNCFSHSDRPAVGVCLVCGRGVCAECAVDQGRAIACRGRCEVEMQRLMDLRDFSLHQPNVQRHMLRRSKVAVLWSAGFLLVLGVSFVVWGYMTPQLKYLGVLGALFIIWGGLQVINAVRQPRADQFRLCGNCGYNITGNTTGRCPECGNRI